MTDETSARLALPFLAGGQMQKHVTVNAALSRLDALLHLGVESRTRAAEPADPDEGQAWLIPTGATGADWGVMAPGAVATWQDGGWLALTPPLGAVAFVLDEGQAVVRTALGWTPLGALLGRIDAVDRLGVGTSPDAANPLAARLNAALLAARPVSDGGTGDVRLTLSKAATGDVGSLLLQTDFGGRAEIGLIGDDALSIKVSADGGAWREALRADPASGRVTFAQGSVRREATVMTASGVYAPPVWARSLEVAVLGGGGGGGGAGGQGGAAASLRMGGGGGGAGGRAHAVWSVEALDGELTVTVGTGGVGGGAGLDGADGGTSLISLDGLVLLRALGGGGGLATGAAGAGGLASRVGNGGGSSSPTSVGGDGATAPDPEGPGGGGGGGSVSAADVAHVGGSGGAGGLYAVLASPGTGGGSAGAPGVDAPRPDFCLGGGGGAGGGGSATTAGHAGGAAGRFGAGGGGGGAGLSIGGVGGAGAAGVVVITAVG